MTKIACPPAAPYRSAPRKALLMGVSAIALLVGASHAEARQIGPGAVAPTTAAVNAAVQAAQQAAAIAKQSQSSLLRATQALQSVQAVQAAARAAANAKPAAVADGLQPGGLVVDRRVTAGTDTNLWINADLPTQSTSNGATMVTVRQSASRAVMTWEQFNVGRNTTLYYDQSGGNSANGNGWVALNRIDASGVPSQIEGRIKAEGTVLLINANGIIFNGTSQINVHTLIASTLDINSYGSVTTPNLGAFLTGADGGKYLNITSGGQQLFAANGTPLLAPPNEDNANVSFVAKGLYVNGAAPDGSGGSLIFAAGSVANQASAGIVIRPGASISTDVGGFDNGGYVALVGQQVSNGGSISTPAGQIILAAAPNLWFFQPAASGSATKIAVATISDQGNFGLSAVYEAPKVPGGASAANQSGALLSATRGNITLLGDIVDQSGVAAVTTSVTRAGSINIYASQLLTLGASSVTSILPEENGETIPTNSISAFVAPSITINAGQFDMHGSQNGAPGSLIVAPGATMTVGTASIYSPLTGFSSKTPIGRALLEAGSVIDLTGLDAATSIGSYLYTFKVTANDVADSPLAQGLIGQTVTIDLRRSGVRADGLSWVGSPLFSSTGQGYLDSIPKTIDQLLTKGGSLNFVSYSAGYQPFRDILQQSGSVVSIAGGHLAFTGGVVNTTMLLGLDGRRYDIASIDPFAGAVGKVGSFTVNHPHWGISESYSGLLSLGSHFDPGYVDTISAGSLTLNAVNPILEGAILAAATPSERQTFLNQSGTGANSGQSSPDELPAGGALSIAALASAMPIGAIQPGGDAIVLQGATGLVLGPDFTMASALNVPQGSFVSQITPASPVLVSSNILVYSTDILSAAGFGSIAISSAMTLSVTRDAVLTVQDGGSIKLGGVDRLDGRLVARAGSITVTGFVGGTLSATAPPASVLTIGPSAVLDASGLWVNDSGAGPKARGAAYTNGGSVTIQTYAESSVIAGDPFNLASAQIADTTQSIAVASGSVIDVSSGGYVQPNGLLKTGTNGLPVGTGGNLSIRTYVDNPGNPNKGWEGNIARPNSDVSTAGNIAPNGARRPNQASIMLAGTIYSGGLNGGGTFTLQAPILRIGGVDAFTSYAPSSTKAGELDLPSSFFASNGFAKYALTSTYGDVTIAAGTTLLLQQKTYQLANTALPGTGASLRDFAVFGLAPAGLRGPTSLTVSQNAYVYGGPSDPSTNAGILVDSGASIIGEPGASIALTANGPLTVLGSLIARGGNISLVNNGQQVSTQDLGQPGNFGAGNTQAPLDLWIGPKALIDVSGVFVPNPLISTYRSGKVLDGGTITLSGGTIVAMPGSMFDLAGASAVLDVPSRTGLPSGPLSAEQPLWSNGGTLTLLGSSGVVAGQAGEYQAAYFAGTVNAAGGSALAEGGNLILGEVFSGGSGYNAIIIPQGGNVTAAFNSAALTSSATAYPKTFAQLAALLPNTNGYAYVSADTLNNSGFGSVSLMGHTIAFSGNVTIRVPGALTVAGNMTLLPSGGADPSFTGASVGRTVVNLVAGYVQLASNQSAAPQLADGMLNINAAAQIDLSGYISVSNAANVSLTSGGDIRLLAETDPMFAKGVFGNGGQYFTAQLGLENQQTSQSVIQSPGMLAVASNLTLTSREVYPTSDAAFMLMSTGLGAGPGTNNTVTIASNGRTPVAPLSANGMILIDAQTIVQSGVLVAPLGTIELGLAGGQPVPTLWTRISAVPAAVTTQSVTLSPGSVTSVSAAGLDIPYGTTINGGNWSVISSAIGDPQAYPAMTAPPAKNILINGAAVNTMAGAVVDLSGGGDIFASEFVAGTGGSVNVLTSAAAGQTVYAIVPGYAARVAAGDTIYGQTLKAGASITIAGGNGIAAGTYTLLPAMYATLPGAYRVVVTSKTSQLPVNSVAADGTVYMTATLGNSISGARSSQMTLLQIQPNATWTQYSEIDIAKGTSYFSRLAAVNGTAVPPLPVDGGVLTLNATNSLNLQGSNNFAAAPGGRGGIAAITGTNLLVLASDRTAPAADAGYIVLDADQLSRLGATTLLLGGTSTSDTTGQTIAAGATNLEIETDAAHPLTGPDILLVTTAQNGANGLTVDAGSVIRAVGTVSAGSNADIKTGAGSLLRISNSLPIQVIRSNVTTTDGWLSIGTTPGSSALDTNAGAPVVISGLSLMIDTSGSASLDPTAVLNARNYALTGSVINLGDVPVGSAGLTISPQLIAQFAGADTVTLRSNTVFNFYDGGGISFGTAANPIGTLTFDGAGLYSNGGSTTIVASNIDLTNSADAKVAGALNAGGGVLALNAAGVIIFDAGATSIGGFGTVGFNAGRMIGFGENGSVDAGAAAVTLAAPALVVLAASSQSLTTTGVITIQSPSAAVSLPSGNIGGALTLTGGSIDDSGTIVALAGKVTLAATSGDVVLSSGASIVATGSHITMFDLVEDAPGGLVKLSSASGNVTVGNGAVIDVSATGAGYAGSLSIATAADKTATLNGRLTGSAAYDDLGGNFTLSAGHLVGQMPFDGGFSGSFQAALQQGDIVVPVNATLRSGQVLLVANNGSVIVDGVIDASGPNGGSIALYGTGISTDPAGTAGATGVTINATARLLASYRADDPKDPLYGNGESTLVQNGGTIMLGTSGIANGTYNTTYGYENIDGSGAITVASGATFDISGGVGGTNISNNGGSIIVRAPILTNGSINVSFKGTVKTPTNGSSNGSVAVNAYAVWSTKDTSSSPAGRHFDGIVDPAGWFSNSGAALPGMDQNGYAVNAPTPQSPLQTGSLFTPDAANNAHILFYQNTLVSFVQNPFDASAIAGDFAGAQGVSLGSNLHLQPEINLINPDKTINGGNVTVASNWNLGAGTADSSGNVTLFYRTRGGVDAGRPGVLTLSAANNIQINATISDGFFVPYASTTMPTIIPGSVTTRGSITPGQNLPPPNVAQDAYTAALTNSDYISYKSNLSGGQFDYNFGSLSLSDAFGSIPTALIGPATLQAPAMFSSGDAQIIDQYNQSYAAYVSLFLSQARFMWAYNGGFGPPDTAPAHLPPPAPTAATAGNYLTRGTGYVWQYAQYLVDENVINQGSGLSSVSTLALNDLLSQIANNMIWSEGCGTCIAYAAPFAPYFGLSGGQPNAASLPALQPGYVATAPIITPPVIIAPVGFVAPRLATAATQQQIAAAAAMMVDSIANNPGVDATLIPRYNTTASSALMPSGFAGSQGSFSYDFVAGTPAVTAGTTSVDPTATVNVPAGVVTTGPTPSLSVTIDGHVAFKSANSRTAGVFPVIDIPTIVRTGTGSITFSAAGSFELLDAVAPGAVYTAGVAKTSATSDFTAPTLPAVATLTATNGLLSSPAWATGGGSITILAGTDIVGIETPIDDAGGSQTGIAKSLTGEFWSAWYYRAGQTAAQQLAPFANGIQNSTWVNYATFFQGIGALGGGNITLKAGADIADISASLPETIQVSGGKLASGPAATAHYYGGGNLVVTAGGNLLSSTFYVGRGTGDVRIGGAVMADPANPVTGAATAYQDVVQGALVSPSRSLPLLLALQDGAIAISAGGAVSLGAVFDPAAIPQDTSLLKGPTNATITPAGLGTTFRTYGANSGVSLTSLAGNVDIGTLADLTQQTGGRTDTSLFGTTTSLPTTSALTAPANLSAQAFLGDISFDAAVSMMPSPTGNLSLIAGGSISTTIITSDIVLLPLTMLDGTVASNDFVPLLLGKTAAAATLSKAWHASDPTSAIIYAGKDIAGDFSLIKQARIEAGRDIVNTVFVGQNNSSTDLTSLIAGRDIIARQVSNGGGVIDTSSSFQLYGPGTLLIQAGRNLGPFFTAAPSRIFGYSFTGIATLGDGSTLGNAAVRSYLPLQGASIYTLFGVGAGIDYQAAIARYVDPASAGADGIDFLTYIAATLGETRPDAWTTFRNLPAARQQLLIDAAYLKFISQVGIDFNDKHSPYFNQYGRAYQAISTLFPASLGYTDNRPTGSNGAATTRPTGDLSMAHSLLETQNGGSIFLIGPGGNINVGANAADNSKPNQEGILTLQGGSILSYTDGSVIVDQSRIFTEQGGDIDLFSANADLNAGKGPKSKASYPPLSLIWNPDGYTRVNPTGLVTGAGIGALLSVPGQDPSLSNVNLVAPRGTVDAGAAGIRVSGNLNIAALQVLNAFNIQVTGTTTGLATVQGPPVAALTSASNTAAAAAKVDSPAQTTSASGSPSIIIVEVLGYGGGAGDGDGNDGERAPARRGNDRQSYDTTSPVQIVGTGTINSVGNRYLTEDEKTALSR